MICLTNTLLWCLTLLLKVLLNNSQILLWWLRLSGAIWHKDKSPQNRARLRKQIAHCNSLLNKDKYSYYRNLVNKNAQDSKRLWQVLHSTGQLHSDPESVLPSHESKECLANRFVTYFSDKIAKIRDAFSSTESFRLPAPSDLSNFDSFKIFLMKKIKRQL